MTTLYTDVSEEHVASRASLAIGLIIGARARGIGEGLGFEQDGIKPVSMDAEIFKAALLDGHPGRRLNPKDTIAPVIGGLTIVACIVNDVDMASFDMAHHRSIALIADAEHVGTVRPELAVTDGDVLTRLRIVGCKSFNSNVIVLAAQEAVTDADVGTVADIDGIVVEHVRSTDFQVIDIHAITVFEHDRPTVRMSDGDVAQAKVTTVLRQQHVTLRAVPTLVAVTRQYAPFAQSNKRIADIGRLVADIL